jgi:hypothetical protein
MCIKKGSGESAGTALPFCASNMDYIQVVDVIFLDLVSGDVWQVYHEGSLQSVPVPAAIPSFRTN